MLRVVRLVVSIFTIGLLLQVMDHSVAAEKRIYGLHEQVYIKDLDISLEAKLDSGATTSSISADKIKRFERDGEEWVSFRLSFDDAPEKKFEMPLVRTSKVKRRADDFDPETDKGYSKRPVVEMELTMGDQTHVIEVNLTDRSHFKYPFLMGAKALRQFNALIDVNERMVADAPSDSDEKDNS